MIGSSSTGSSFGGLGRYLIGDVLDEPEERVSYIGEQRLFKANPKWAVTQMRSTAAMSTRVEEPVYHLSISYPEEDETTREDRLWVMKNVLVKLDLDEHQALFVEHDDTEYDHLHAMVNRVHPREGTAWQGSYGWVQIEKVLREYERTGRWRQVSGFHARPDGTEKPSPALSRAQIEQKRRQGKEPFPEEVKRRVGKYFENARTWRGLEEDLSEEGLKLKMKPHPGRGGAVTDGDRFAALSAVSLKYSGPRLAREFGESYAEYDARRRDARKHDARKHDARGAKGVQRRDDPQSSEPRSDGSQSAEPEPDNALLQKGVSWEKTETRGVYRRLKTYHESAREGSSPRRAAALKEEVLRAWRRTDPYERRSFRDGLTPLGNRRLDEALIRANRSDRRDPREDMTPGQRDVWTDLRRFMRAEESLRDRDPLSQAGSEDLRETLAEALSSSEESTSGERLGSLRGKLTDREEKKLDRARGGRDGRSRERSRSRSRGWGRGR